nr:L-threonine ammonia-lyase-like [Nerophis lumbriciformis]
MASMITLQDILEARQTVGNQIVQTPTLASPKYSARTGVDVWFKYEILQTTGSFKVRGALNRIAALDAEGRRRGVVAASAGNHAQGVAYAAAQLDIPATIVMPEATPQVKVQNTQAHGKAIEIVLFGDSFDAAYDHALELQRKSGAIFIHAYNDPLIVAGQGTLGLELLEQVKDLEAVIVPIGGGGLISGIATAVREQNPEVKIYGVQTESAPAVQQSFAGGQLIDYPSQPSIADGITVKRPGSITFEIIRRLVEDVVLVSEPEIERALIDLLDTGNCLVEGAAAAGVAALEGPLKERLHGRRVAVVLCGGNIDLAALDLLLQRGLARRQRLVRLRGTVDDRPGGLYLFLKVIAEQKGSVVHVVHDRVFGESRFGKAELEVILEVRNRRHIDRLLEALREAGHEVEELSLGPQVPS